MSARRNCLMSMLAATASVLLTAGLAQADEERADAPLFASHEPLALTLSGPFRSIVHDKSEEPEYHDAKLELRDNDGVARVLDVRVRARGKNRRKPDTCSFPPLRLAIAADAAAGTPFEGQRKLKMVTHCKHLNSFVQYLLKEYLVYRIYNEFTEYSFRVRWLDVTYVDTASRGRTTRRPAFVIEERRDMARRNGARAPKFPSLERPDLDREFVSLFEVFQYMIANTDWSVLRGPAGSRCCHNAVLVAPPSGPVIPVPYDFDYSGFVNAPYALPSDNFDIDRVTQRLYRGFCRPAAELEPTITLFNGKRAAITELIREQDGLNHRSMRSALRFLDRFYKTVNDPELRARHIDGMCR